MTVPEAAIKILQEYPDGLSAKKVTDEILAHKLHPLPAKDPVQIVARAMNRHCIGMIGVILAKIVSSRHLKTIRDC